MRVAFLNLCHTEPGIVGRVARRLTEEEDFDMYVHVDAKSDIQPFVDELEGVRRTWFVDKRHKVYWGGYNAIDATYELIRCALSSDRHYDYFVLLQNLDYPIRSNQAIKQFFIDQKGKEFIRGCNIARTKDWHYSFKYRIYNQRDDDFYLNNPTKLKRYMRYGWLLFKSIKTILDQGVIIEKDKSYDLHYGAAQWAVTRECVKMFCEFNETHPLFNERMKHIQFPDEEYFHTIVHNSAFKTRCIKYDEPEKRWLVNWRNLHYFEFPKTVTVFDHMDYDRIMEQDVLFIRKVKSGISDELMDMIDLVSGTKG